jgi:mannose-6-phosphate isomerase-like protein (cupin superfamily)
MQRKRAEMTIDEPSATGADFVTYAAGEGDPLSQGVQVVGRAEWTDGAYAALAIEVGPGYVTPVHKHLKQSQACFVLSGELGFWVEGEDDVILGPGGYVFRPVGRHHALWNPTDQPARYLEITSPATEFQQWAFDLSKPQSGDALSEEEVAERSAQVGIYFAPDLTQELTDRLGRGASAVLGR